MGVFKKEEPAQEPVAPKASAKKPTKGKPFGSSRLPQPAGASFFFNAPTPVPFNSPRALTAAASQVKMNDKAEFEQFKARRSASSSAWQAEAWEYYDAIGEIKYAFNLVASVVSRIRIFAAAIDDPSQSPVAASEAKSVSPELASAAERALSRLNSAYGGQPGLLKDAALNLAVTGECYLVQMPARKGTGEPESWDIRSVDEVVADGSGNLTVIGRREQAAGQGGGNNSGVINLGKNAFVGRIWRSHPRYSDESDSSLRGLLDMCLAEGTLVYTPKGAVPIESVSAGDLVYSRNPDSGELVQSMASRVWSTGVKPVYKVASRGRSIRATGNHPVLVLRDSNPATKKGVSAKYELSYVRVDELSKGDMLISFETAGTSNRRGDLPMRRNKSAKELLSLDQPFVVSSVKSIVPDGEATVWDMTVPDTENFIADGLVVHNCAELLLLNRTFRATARSRLNAGALYLPDGLSVASQGDPANYPYDSEDGIGAGFTAEEAEDEFEEQLMDAMTTPIRDEESASAVVPLIIRGPAELGGAIKQFKFERSFDPALAERSDRVLERILQGLDVPKDVITGLANVKYCLSEDTEILTKRGWLTHDELSSEDEVLTLNRTTGNSEWQTPSAVNVFDVDETDQLLSIESESHSSLSTMNHGWHVRRQTSANGRAAYDWVDTTSEHLAVTSNVFIPTSAPHGDVPIVKSYSDEFVELVAWWYTEGYLRETETSGVFDSCVNRDDWVKALSSRRSELGLSRREVVQRMGKHVNNANAASGHMIHMERSGAVLVKDRIALASALEVAPENFEKFFTPRRRPDLGVIAQSLGVYPQNVERIRRTLTAMCDGHGMSNGEARGRRGEKWWTESDTNSNGMVYFNISDALVSKIKEVCPGKEKIVSTEFITKLTAKQLELFIDVSILADGHERKDGRKIITQGVSERLDAIELAVILSGRTPIRSEGVGMGFKPGPLYRLAIKSRNSVAVAKASREIVSVASGKVWCPTTPNGSWMARRNGKVFFTLNSNALQIDEALYKAHIEPLMLLIVDALTVVYLRPYLIANGYSESEVSRITVWYDPSAVSTRNDRATDADAGFDRGAVSYDTWRRAHGFSDQDAPTPTELAIRMLQEKGSITPELSEAMLGAISPDIMNAVRKAQQGQSVAPLPTDVEEVLKRAAAGDSAPEGEEEEEAN